MDFNNIKEHVISNIISVGIIIGIITFITIDVKREIYFNGTTKSIYKIHLF